jgi:hypothetical protein
MGRGVVLVALALAASLSLPAFAAGDVIRDEFFSCAAYEEQGDEPGLLIAACNPRMLARAYALGDDFPEVKFEGTSGGVQDKVPLLVTGIDPLSDPVLRPTIDSPDLIVWATLTYAEDDYTSMPEGALFPPISVKTETAIHLNTTGQDLWKLTDASGRVLASARPRFTPDARPKPPRPTLTAAHRHGKRVRVDFKLDRGYNGQSLFSLVARGARGRYSWERSVRTGLTYGATTGSFSIRVPRTATALRLVASEASDYRGSAELQLRHATGG